MSLASAQSPAPRSLTRDPYPWISRARCACTACSRKGSKLAASDERRRHIAALDYAIQAEDADDGAVEAMVAEQLELIGTERLPEIWATNSLMRASLVANRRGDDEDAARWWLRMHTAMRTALGVREDDVVARAMADSNLKDKIDRGTSFTSKAAA